MDYLKRLMKYLDDCKISVVIGLIFALAGISCSMTVPKVSKHIIDDVLVARRFEKLYYFALILAGLVLSKAALNYFQSYIFEYTSQKAIYKLREQLYTKLQYQSFEYFDRASTGAIMNRMVGDLEAIRNFLNQSFVQVISIVITLVLALSIMLSMNVLLSFLSLATIPLIYFNVKSLAKKLQPTFRAIRVAFEKLTSKVQENITGIRVVKAFGNEELEKKSFEKVAFEFTSKNIQAADIRSVHNPLANFLNGLNSVIILVIGGYLAIKGKITIGTLFAFLSYVNLFSAPIGNIQNLVNQWQNAFASLEKVFEVLDSEVLIKSPKNAIHLKNIKGDIKFENVYFKYKDKFVLKGINIHISPGEVVAILGQAGSGKSSLINLLARFYDPTSGRVLIDDVDVKNVKLCSLRRNIGIIMQETFIFSDTIAANIAFGKPDAKEEEIKWAAKLARADEFIERLPEGYNTIVGERGIGLSGGQKQRIAIARALIYNPKILVLDDATSNLDFETEAEIQNTLKEVIKGRTTIIITHRISQLVVRADRIYYMQDGRIVEQGTHEELMKLKGRYYATFKKQLLERANSFPA
ncbi:ABC transporter ATP-binding protein [Anaerocellum danielii]|uniref:ABC transporter ATP-binding protein n=1 Tax=Anaerocellum danielii TaxID=1387557 RepID=A0ABZ0TZK5_9FIRM|nr:ABC transporter ATP-binding protein [Caldicellulosiruptor danielii]WPX08889.1 ABC transporter ATP-binding protein [Caldicellulosiruptor danielii]